MSFEFSDGIFTERELDELRLIGSVNELLDRADVDDGSVLSVRDSCCSVVRVVGGCADSIEISIPGSVSDDTSLRGYYLQAPQNLNAKKGSWTAYEMYGPDKIVEIPLDSCLVDLATRQLASSIFVCLEPDGKSRKLLRREDRHQKLNDFRTRHGLDVLPPAITYLDVHQTRLRRQLWLGAVSLHMRLHMPVERVDSVR